MKRISALAQQIRDYVNKGQLYDRYFENDLDKWNRLCVSMDTLGDSCLPLAYYESAGIGRDDGEKYLRLYGLLQAVILQQYSIAELYGIFVGKKLNFNSNPALKGMRDIRVWVAGHPIESNSPMDDKATRRSVVTRVSINDEGFWLVIWNKDTGENEFKDIDLKGLYSSYKCEAIRLLETVITSQIEQYGALPTD